MAGPKGETAQVCSICGRLPVKGSMNCYTTKREKGFVIYRAVCGGCKLKEMRPGNETRS